MRSGDACRKHSRGCRLNRHDFYVGISGFEIFADARYRSARADACDEKVNFSFRIIINFGACMLKMRLRVCRIYKLPGDKAVRYFFCKFVRFFNCALHSFCAVCQNEFCAVCLHYLSALDGHRFRHNDYNSVTPCRRDGRKPYTGISGGRLDYDRAFFEKSPLLRVIYHRLCDSVLDGACRIEIFQLCKDFRFQSERFFYVSQLHKRRAADEFICRFVYL